MNDLIPRACCHISDKIGRNEKNRSKTAPVFHHFSLLLGEWNLLKFCVNLQTIPLSHFNHKVSAFG